MDRAGRPTARDGTSRPRPRPRGTSTGRPSCVGEHLDARRRPLDHRRADEHAGERRRRRARRRRAAPRTTRAGGRSRCGARCTSSTPSGAWSARPSTTSRASRISPAQVAERRHAVARARRAAARAAPTCRAACRSWSTRRRAGRARRPRRARSGRATSTASTPSASSTSRARGTPPAARGPRLHAPFHLEASRRRGRHGARHQPRSASFTSSVSISSPRIASPRPRDTLATIVGVG